ncbi:hypothetical protein CB1_000706012 [Camelus ferus]|nr:hypothetical protein CB1_000706012 [Camelus ferus]
MRGCGGWERKDILRARRRNSVSAEVGKDAVPCVVLHELVPRLFLDKGPGTERALVAAAALLCLDAQVPVRWCRNSSPCSVGTCLPIVSEDRELHGARLASVEGMCWAHIQTQGAPYL